MANKKEREKNEKKKRIKRTKTKKESKSVKKEQKEKQKKSKTNKEAKNKKARKKEDTLLKDVEPEHYFLVCDGQVLKNIFDLIDALDTMTEDVFSYHVNDEKNDIFNWIKDVFKEEELAERIIGIRDPLRLEIALLREIIGRTLKK